MKHFKYEVEDDGEIDLAFDNRGSIWLMHALTTARLGSMSTLMKRNVYFLVVPFVSSTGT
jgi:hypothetical protein